MMNSHTAAFPLPFADPGRSVQLVAIRADDAVRRRLADLGLTVGMPLRIVQSGADGALILAVREDARLALGRGMAQKIIVQYRAEGA